MTTPAIRILLLEDTPSDAALVERELRKAGLTFESRLVDGEPEFRRALLEFAPDIVLSDHNLPQFSGWDAVRLVRDLKLDIPVILVTGSLNEETAVEYMKAGAADYVLKDRPARLGAAVRGALERRREREEKERAVAARLETEERLSVVVQATNDAVWDWEPATGALWVNESFWQLFGHRPEAVRSFEKLWVEQIHPDDRGRVRAKFDTFLTGEEPHWSDEYRFRRADGTYAYVLNRGHAIRDGSGAPLRVIGALTDVTRLVSAEQKYRSIFDTAPFGIYQATPDGRILTANPTLARILGYDSSDELLGRSWPREILADTEELTQQLARMLPGARSWNVEIRCRRKDGRTVWVQVDYRKVIDGTGKARYFEGFVHDIDEHKQLEQQLRQSQKIEAIGQLAGGVAHDFNNILTAILGYADLLKEELPENDPKRADVNEIRMAADRAAALTRQLLAFSRRQVLELTSVDLNGVVGNVDKMLRRLIGEDVEFRTVLAPDLGSVRADAGQVEQVILNLVVNARDAMPNGGKITLQTANIELDADYAAHHVAVRPGPYVMLAVSDNGMGMDESVKARIFEPFFTTKGPGKGTGLGLSTVYGIVKQSGGSIWVYSEVGRGTTFKIYLPRTAQAGRVAAHRPSGATTLRGSETVLLVEDAEGVRTLARRVLMANGYVVLEAARGRDALRTAQEFQGVIHLLLTDVVMPEMSGRDLAAQLLQKRPDTRVLYMSGYTDDAAFQNGLLDEGVAYVQKPFTSDRLLGKVREVLESP